MTDSRVSSVLHATSVIHKWLLCLCEHTDYFVPLKTDIKPWKQTEDKTDIIPGLADVMTIFLRHSKSLKAYFKKKPDIDSILLGSV